MNVHSFELWKPDYQIDKMNIFKKSHESSEIQHTLIYSL